MDHLSFMFSLLLIVSVTSTTLGSAIKAKNPNGEELEPLLEPSDYSNPRMNSRDQVSERQKRLYPATVIPGNNLQKFMLGGFRDEIGRSMYREITIGIDNESGFKWMKPSYYFSSGNSYEKLLPLEDEKAVLYHVVTKGSAGEVAGVVAYYISEIEVTIAFMFHLHHKYDLGKNLWNVKLYSGEKQANSVIYHDMISDTAEPMLAADWHERDLGLKLKFQGAMSVSGRVTLEIHVEEN